MNYKVLLETMCKRCINHEICQGTGCHPKNELEKLAERANKEKHDFSKATKEIIVDIIMNVPDEVTADEVWDKLVDFSETNGWYFGGGIKAYKEGEDE